MKFHRPEFIKFRMTEIEVKQVVSTWHRGVVVITNAQSHAIKSELRFSMVTCQRFAMVRTCDSIYD